MNENHTVNCEAIEDAYGKIYDIYDDLIHAVYTARIAAYNKYRATRIVGYDSVALGLVQEQLDKIKGISDDSQDDYCPA
jgi:hypothetical protein